MKKMRLTDSEVRWCSRDVIKKETEKIELVIDEGELYRECRR